MDPNRSPVSTPSRLPIQHPIRKAVIPIDPIITQVTSLSGIDDLLAQFTPCLQSLSSGRVSRTVLAGKLHRYGVVLVASIGNEIISFAGFYCNDTLTRRAYLSMLAVMPGQEGKGYGKQTVRAVMQHAAQAGMQTLELEVNKNNHAAIGLYKKMGFCFLPNETHDSYYMTTQLQRVSYQENETV